MGKPTDKSVRMQLIFGSVLLMLIALFTSRVLLSIGFISFLLLTIVHDKAVQQLKEFIQNPLLVGLSVLFLIPLLSGLWSEDQHHWLRSVRIKLPLVLFPLAFAGRWQLSKKQWAVIAAVFLLLVAAGCIWSLAVYITDLQDMNTGYLRAKSIPTPLENDHIRFSLLVCIAMIIAAFLALHSSSSKLKLLYILAIIFFFIYLHILSARTGLFAAYGVLLAGTLYGAFHSGKKLLAVSLLAFIILLPLLAYQLLPTFRNRVKYMIYDFSFIREEQYLPGSNDGSRTVSLRAGWQLLKKNPFGVGSGDVVNETMTWYRDYEPRMLATALYPSSEWLMYGGIAGWPGMILFTVVMLIPVFINLPHRFFFVAVSAVLSSSLLFDIGLEVQFGVFIHAFVLLCWWKMLKDWKKNRESASEFQSNV